MVGGRKRAERERGTRSLFRNSGNRDRDPDSTGGRTAFDRPVASDQQGKIPTQLVPHVSRLRGIELVAGSVAHIEAFDDAAEMAELIPSNPVRKTKLPRRGPAKERAVIAPEKIRALLNALPEPSHALAHLLVFTGLRIGELLAVRWQDVDLERAVLRVTRTVSDGIFDVPKSQRSKRSVPLGAKAIEILSAKRPSDANPTALIFATQTGSAFDRHNLLNRQLNPTCTKIGLVGVNWHWLRHANATLLDAVGTPLGTVQALLGHSSSGITRELYLHSIPSDARAGVQKVEDC